MKLRTLFPVLMLILAMLACNLPSNVAVTETPTAQQLVLPSATATLIPPTALPTQTPLPSNTPPPTLTSTPTVPVAFARDVNVNCRLGPSTAWLPISALVVGQTAQITAKSADGSWWGIVDPASPNRRCWVSSSVVNTAGNVAGIPVGEAPQASVTNVTITVDPKTISVPGCMGPIQPSEITGTIETNGPVTVKWRFETQLGGSMGNQSTNFDTFGTKEFEVDYTPPLSAGNYWIRLIVTSPNDMQAEVKYKVEC